MTERINYEQLGEFKAKKALSGIDNHKKTEKDIDVRVHDQINALSENNWQRKLVQYQIDFQHLTSDKIIFEPTKILDLKNQIADDFITLTREMIVADNDRRRQILYKRTLQLKREAIKRRNEDYEKKKENLTDEEKKKEYLTEEEKNSRFRDIEKFKEANQKFIQLSELQIAYESLLLKIEKHLHPDQYSFPNKKEAPLASTETESNETGIEQNELTEVDKKQVEEKSEETNSDREIVDSQETEAVIKEEKKATEQSVIIAPETKNHLSEEQSAIINHESLTANQDSVSDKEEKNQARVQELQNRIDALKQTPAYQDYDQYLKLINFESELKSLKGAETKKEKFFLPIEDRINFLEKEIPQIKKSKSYQDVLISQQINELKSQLAYLDYDDPDSLNIVKNLEPQIKRLSSKLNHENLPSVISELTLLEKELATLNINQHPANQQKKENHKLASANNQEVKLLELQQNQERLQILENKLSVLEKILITSQKIDKIKKSNLYQKYFAGEKDLIKINNLVKKITELDEQTPTPTKEIDQITKEINKLKKGKKYLDYLITITYISQIISLKNELIKIKENQDFAMNEIKERGKYLQIKINNLQKLLPNKQMVEYQEYVIREIKYHEDIINEIIALNPHITLDETMEDDLLEKLQNGIKELKSQIEVQST